MKTILSLIAAAVLSLAGTAWACDGAGADNGKANKGEKQAGKNGAQKSGKDGKEKAAPPARG